MSRAISLVYFIQKLKAAQQLYKWLKTYKPKSIFSNNFVNYAESVAAARIPWIPWSLDGWSVGLNLGAEIGRRMEE